MNKLATKLIIIATAGNLLYSIILTLELNELKKRFIVLHDDFNLVAPKFSNDIWKLYEKLK